MAGKSVRLAETPCAAMQEHDAGARLDRVWTLKQEGNLRAVEGGKKDSFQWVLPPGVL